MKYNELKELRDKLLPLFVNRGVKVTSNFPAEYKLTQRECELEKTTISWVIEGTQFIPHFKPVQHLIDNDNLIKLSEIAGYDKDFTKEPKISHKIKETTFACGVRLSSKDISYEYDIFGFDNEFGFLIHSKNPSKDTDIKWQPVKNQFMLWNAIYELHILPVEPHIFAEMMRVGLIHLKK